MLQGQKHIIECSCYLPQDKNLVDPPRYSFVMFSIIKDGNVFTKYVRCNNCNVIHEVYELCKSKTITGKDTLVDITTIDKTKQFLPVKLCNILENYNAALFMFEEAAFIYEHNIWGMSIILTSEEIIVDNRAMNEGKKLVIKSANEFIIENWKSEY